MVDFIKLVLWVFSFGILVSSVFAGYITDNLGTVFRDIIDNVLLNVYVMYFLFFVAMFFGCYALVVGALRLAFKKHDYHKKEIKVISFMVSFMGVSGLFIMLTNSNSEADLLRALLSIGSWAILTVWILVNIILMYVFIMWSNVYEKPIVKKFLYSLGAVVTIGNVLALLSFMLIEIGGLSNPMTVLMNILEDLLFLAILASIVFGFMLLGGVFSMRGISDSMREAEEEKTPGIGELRESLDLINKEVSTLDNYFKENRSFLEGK